MDLLVDTIKLVVSTYVGGVACIICGVYVTYKNIQNPSPVKSFDPLQGSINGWLGAVGLIVLGVAIVYRKMTGG